MQQVFGDGTAYGVDLHWSVEHEPHGTTGGLRIAESQLRDGDEPVLVLSGDGLHNVDVSQLVRLHRERGGLVTIALTPVADPREYGVAIVDDAHRITSFQEKPALGDALSNLANTGIYVLDPAVFDLIPPAGEFHDFGDHLLPAMLAEGLPIAAVTLDGYWNDIGGLEAYRDSNLAAVDGRTDGLMSAQRDDASPSAYGDDVLVHPTADIAPDATIVGPAVIGPGARIGAGARVARSVVLPGADVPAGSLLAAATFGSVEGLTAWANSLA
jgi:NDP-sugar pyrophosphorylase family protein